jgi:tRNA modification GTPase
MDHSGEDTICAIATPPGEGGVGIVRVSGEHALDIATKIVQPKNCLPLDQLTSHRLYLSDVLANASLTPSQSFSLDEALVVVMRRPRSYTGEDVVEIQTHGGPLILQSTCEALIQQGARLAEPGEFTKRAFLNGRLDLTQAEGVLDTIQATTSSSLRTAQELLRGNLRREVDRLKDELIKNLAHLEAGMDFVEEDISFIQTAKLEQVLQETQSELQELIKTFEEGRILREGITAALIGRPNVGKSSLLNALLKMDRAIVSSVPGTTRDVIDESVNIAGLPMRLIDTAGLRPTEDSIEEEGIRRTKEALEHADLILFVMDGSVEVTEEDRRLLSDHGKGRCLILVNKSDLSQKTNIPEIVNIVSPSEGMDNCKVEGDHDDLVVRLSAKTGLGIDSLKEKIRSIFMTGNFESREGPTVTHLRHKAGLAQACESIGQSLRSIQKGMDGECIALDMRAALDSLGEITGTVSTDDILDRVFRDFCIGK